MRIVMDFDGVFTDPANEGDECSRHFSDKILGLKLKGLETAAQVDSWLGELRVRQAVKPFDFGWRSEGRVSAFTFEDPFIRAIGLADYLDFLVAKGDARAKLVLGHLVKREKINHYRELSEWAFHQLKMRKQPDKQAIKWVLEMLKKNHEVFIVSNSSTEKIDDFLMQNEFDSVLRPKVRGGAKKFALGTKAKRIALQKKDADHKPVEVDTDRPTYEKALMEIQPDAIIGDVFSLDLALPIRLKREGKLEFKGGIHYRLRDYTPTTMLDFVSPRQTLVPEVSTIRNWSQFKL